MSAQSAKRSVVLLTVLTSNYIAMHSKKDVQLMGVLLKGYDFATVQEYYEYIGESFINGQGQQAKNLFLEMPKSYQIRLLTWQDGLRFQLTERDQVKLTAWAIDANFDTYLLNI